MPSVFLSYRPGDDGDYVESFARDLHDAIDGADDPGGTNLLYLSSDDSVAGDRWLPKAVTALAEATIFVAVCSERYFLTERCGREWWTFAERCEHHEAATRRRLPAIVPVSWGRQVSVDDLPRGRNVSDVVWGPDLRALSRLQTRRGLYDDVVKRLARHVVDVSRVPVSRATTILPYRGTPDAFKPAGDAQSAPQRARGPAVQFVVAAGRRDEMAPIRDHLDYYGDRPADWAPFDAQGREPLVRRAQAVATEHSFRSDVVDDLERIGEVLDRAEAEDRLVVLLVDAWSVQLAGLRRALAEVDRRSHTVAVVAPISAGDPETLREKRHLGSGVLRMLAQRGRSRDPMLRIGPDSSETFDEQLGKILEATRNRSYRTARVRRTGPAVSAPGTRTLPVLDVP